MGDEDGGGGVGGGGGGVGRPTTGTPFSAVHSFPLLLPTSDWRLSSSSLFFRWGRVAFCGIERMNNWVIAGETGLSS